MKTQIIIIAAVALLIGCGKGQTCSNDTGYIHTDGWSDVSDTPPAKSEPDYSHCSYYDGKRWWTSDDPCDSSPSPSPTPDTSLIGRVTTFNGVQYFWDGAKWRRSGSPIITLDIPAPTPYSAPSPIVGVDSVPLTIGTDLHCTVVGQPTIEGTEVIMDLKCSTPVFTK